MTYAANINFSTYDTNTILIEEDWICIDDSSLSRKVSFRITYWDNENISPLVTFLQECEADEQYFYDELFTNRSSGGVPINFDDIADISLSYSGASKKLNYYLDCYDGNGYNWTVDGIAYIYVGAASSGTTRKWSNLLDMLYPVGSIILWSTTATSPGAVYGGTWTNISSTYNNRYLALCTSNTGGADISAVSYQPAGTLGAVTLQASQCNVAKDTFMSTTTSGSTYTLSHSHNFSRSVGKVVSSPASGTSVITKPQMNRTSANNYTPVIAWDDSTEELSYQNIHHSNSTWDGYISPHTHTLPNISQQNATASHNHVFTGTTTSINFNPKAENFQLWQRTE